MAAKVWMLLNGGDHIVDLTVVSMVIIIWQSWGGGGGGGGAGGGVLADYSSAGFLVSIQYIWLKTANLGVKQ